MAVVMENGNRRCDENCHSAKHNKCGCVCGGRFHGANVVSTKETERKELEELILKKEKQKSIVFAPDENYAGQPLLFAPPPFVQNPEDVFEGDLAAALKE